MAAVADQSAAGRLRVLSNPCQNSYTCSGSHIGRTTFSRGIMADLSVEAASLATASAGLAHAPDPVPKAETSFTNKRHDLKAFGVLGSLMHAQTQVGKAMDDIAEASAALRGEWANESGILQTISQAFADLDTALAGNAPQARAGHGRMLAE